MSKGKILKGLLFSTVAATSVVAPAVTLSSCENGAIVYKDGYVDIDNGVSSINVPYKNKEIVYNYSATFTQTNNQIDPSAAYN